MAATVLLWCFTAREAAAQWHYEGVSAIEGGYGLNIFGTDNTHLSLSLSKYRNRTSYWKGGLNFFEKSFLGMWFCSTGRTYYADGNYFKTFWTNRSFFWFNGGIGLFAGAEVYKSDTGGNAYQFIFGPKITAEVEYFIRKRIALTASLQQQWSPLSDLRRWNTVWNVGVKFLLYD